jgi:hypothetical protein
VVSRAPSGWRRKPCSAVIEASLSNSSSRRRRGCKEILAVDGLRPAAFQPAGGFRAGRSEDLRRLLKPWSALFAAAFPESDFRDLCPGKPDDTAIPATGARYEQFEAARAAVSSPASISPTAWRNTIWPRSAPRYHATRRGRQRRRGSGHRVERRRRSRRGPRRLARFIAERSQLPASSADARGDTGFGAVGRRADGVCGAGVGKRFAGSYLSVSRRNMATRAVVQVGTPQPKKSVSSVQMGQPIANADANIGQSSASRPPNRSLASASKSP